MAIAWQSLTIFGFIEMGALVPPFILEVGGSKGELVEQINAGQLAAEDLKLTVSVN